MTNAELATELERWIERHLEQLLSKGEGANVSAAYQTVQTIRQAPVPDSSQICGGVVE